MLKYAFIVCFVICNIIGLSICKNDTPKEPKIIVVGAGASGIAAASKLFENGFNDVIILEAEDRIGGRIYTTNFGNYLIDLGGQWVHGSKDNVAYELAKPLDLLDETDKPNFGVKQVLYDSSGNAMNEELTNDLSKFYISQIFDSKIKDDKKYITMGEYADKAYDEYFKDKPEMLKNKKKLLDQVEKWDLSGHAAETWNDVSAYLSSQYEMCEGDLAINWKKRGYSTILDILMKRYPNPENELPVLNNTLLYSEVKSIDYSNNDGESPITVTTANGNIYKADHVIVTVSLGVLKDRYKTLFNPPLPESKVSAIEGLGFGSVAKIYLLFDKPFWVVGDDKFLHLDFIWNDDDKKEIEADPEKKWTLGIYAAMSVEYKPNLLTLWITGKYAKIMETIPEAKVFNHSVENLQRFLGKNYNISTPLAMMRTMWFSNPHFKGTYSFPSMETVKRDVYISMLEEPITKENLKILFAGEATSDHRYATVHGAIGSGWKEADRLIDHYKNKQNAK